MDVYHLVQNSRRKSDSPTTPVRQVERDIQQTSTRTGWSFAVAQQQFELIADACATITK